jgi:glycogen(starch) synthase
MIDVKPTCASESIGGRRRDPPVLLRTGGFEDEACQPARAAPPPTAKPWPAGAQRKTLRVLVFAGTYGYVIGGGPVLAPLLLAALAGRGHCITLVTDQLEGVADREAVSGVTIIRLPFRRALGGDFACFAAIRAEILALKRSTDAVYIFSHGRGDLFHHLTHHTVPLPSMVTLHDHYPPAQFHHAAMAGHNLRAASLITACSQATLDWARRHLPEISARSLAVANAVPAPVPAQGGVNPMQLLFAGRLVPQKGCDLAIGGFALLAAQFPAVQLVIAGEGPERAALEATAARLGIAGRVTFLGALPRDRLISVMAGSVVLLVPSRDEPFGLVALEAAHAGRPVVATQVGGLPEVVAHGVSGLIIPPDDKQALAGAVAALLLNPALADRLGAQARARARQQFSFEAFVDTHERLLCAVAGGA